MTSHRFCVSMRLVIDLSILAIETGPDGNWPIWPGALHSDTVTSHL